MFTVKDDATYGLNACYDSIKSSVEKFGEDPIRLLGEYVLRAEQDVFFNKKMITAMMEYLKDNNIEWNYKGGHDAK